jgi:hypothetical protein
MTIEKRQASAYPLRLPDGLRKAVAECAKEDKVSINHFIAIAVAEKISVLKTESYFKGRAAKANMQEFWDFMNRKDGLPPMEEDRIPMELQKKLDKLK